MNNPKLEPIYIQSGVYKKWHPKKLDAFENSDKAKAVVIDYLKNFNKNTIFGLNICGEIGSGKSYLLNCLAKSLIEVGFDVRVIPLNYLMSLYTASFTDGNAKAEMTQILKKAQHLFIEDVGLEFKSDLAKKVLTICIRYRVNVQKPLTIATTLMPKEMVDQYGEEVSSLLKEICIPVRVEGKDYRGKIFNELRETL